MGRLTIDITDQQHKDLKVMAALQGKTIKQYTIERLFPNNIDDDPTWHELKTVIEQRIHDGFLGKISTKSIQNILDEEMDGTQS